ncbi:hypothetical protein SNEBB_010456 [Seison nebaliae]|nr:hypothetical protein SNEBB_010456 [Seison nebaliae]
MPGTVKFDTKKSPDSCCIWRPILLNHLFGGNADEKNYTNEFPPIIFCGCYDCTSDTNPLAGHDGCIWLIDGNSLESIGTIYLPTSGVYDMRCLPNAVTYDMLNLNRLMFEENTLISTCTLSVITSVGSLDLYTFYLTKNLLSKNSMNDQKEIELIPKYSTFHLNNNRRGNYNVLIESKLCFSFPIATCCLTSMNWWPNPETLLKKLDYHKKLFVCGDTSGMIFISKLEGMTTFTNLLSFKSHKYATGACLWLAERIIMTGGEDNVMNVWYLKMENYESNSYKLMKQFANKDAVERSTLDRNVTQYPGHSCGVNCIEPKLNLSHQLTFVATGSYDATIRIYDATIQLLVVSTKMENGIWRLKWKEENYENSDGKFQIVAACLQSGCIIFEFDRHRNQLYQLFVFNDFGDRTLVYGIDWFHRTGIPLTTDSNTNDVLFENFRQLKLSGEGEEEEEEIIRNDKCEMNEKDNVFIACSFFDRVFLTFFLDDNELYKNRPNTDN